MKKKGLVLIILLIVGLYFTINAVYAQTTINLQVSGTYNYDESNKVFTLVNEERRKAGKASLQHDSSLDKIANIRAREAAVYFSHTRPNGEDVLDSFHVYGENIAAGSTTAEGAMNQWMNSEGHKNNILHNSFKTIGIGSFTTKDGATFWVQIFNNTNVKESNFLTGSSYKEHEIVTIKNLYLQQLTIGDFYNKKKIKPGDSYQIKRLLLRNEGWKSVSTVIDNENAKWESSNTKVATIDSKGLIKAFDEGTTTITARLSNLTVSYEIEVVGTTIDIERVSLEKTKVDLVEGETYKLNASVVPENTTKDKTLSYKSTDESIATIDKSGNIKALRAGKTTIIIEATNGKKSECVVVVKSSEIKITGINITEIKGIMTVGDTQIVKAIVEPSNATEQYVFISSNEKVATIDSNGKIKAISAGKTTITAKSKLSSTSIDITIKAKEDNKEVIKEEVKNIPLEGVNLNCSNLTLKVGETFHLDYSYYPANTTDNVSADWLGTYYKIAEFNPKTQTIKAVAAGETKVQVFVGIGANTKVATCNVKVIPANEIERMEIDDAPRLTFNEGRSLNLHIYPETARVASGIKWESSDPSIISVNENGVIYTYEREGTVVITATAPNGIKATRTLTVRK